MNEGSAAQSPWSVKPLCLLLLVSVLAACHTVPVRPPPAPGTLQPWNVRQTQLQSRDHFELKGRVAVATGSEGFNAHLRWVQTGRDSRLTLEGPLGAGAVEVATDGSNLTVINSSGQRLGSDAAHQELVSRLGFEPPLASLRYWVLGVPDPSHPSTQDVDSQQQRLRDLLQDGWQIDYTDYLSGGDGWLPSKMTLQREGVRVRVVVDSWNF